MTPFEILQKNIGTCSLCQDFKPLIKNTNLKRGDKSKLMIIGLSPGKTETELGLAFSGQAGKKLFDWLEKANIGGSELEIREKVYFTSLVKCQKQDLKEITLMFRNCQELLKEQIKLIAPQIIIPLGITVYNILFSSSLKTEDIVGKYFTFNQLNDTPMFPEMSLIYGIDYLVPFPHPSGLNRWLNSPDNTKLLNKSIEILKMLINEK